MGLRVNLARFVIRLGGFIQSLAIMVMRPDDLVEFGRQNYSKPDVLRRWGDESRVSQGLDADESLLVEKIPARGGRVLVLGAGGGRDAIALASRGFDVTGVDFLPEMVQKARENARKRGLELPFLIQDMSELDMPPNAFDIVWCSGGLYCNVPTFKRRVEMLSRICRCLRPGGHFVFNFHWANRPRGRVLAEFMKRVVAILTLGNLSYEEGDLLAYHTEFIHVFYSEDELRTELETAGFEVVRIDKTEVALSTETLRGHAIVRKL